MITVKVFHQDRETGDAVHVASIAYDGGPNDPTSPFDTTPQGYEPILAFAFRRTQNVDGSWSREQTINGQTNYDYSGFTTVVAPLPERNGQTYGHRSTMVGDWMEITDISGFVRRWRVASIGFEEITPWPRWTDGNRKTWGEMTSWEKNIQAGIAVAKIGREFKDSGLRIEIAERLQKG